MPVIRQGALCKQESALLSVSVPVQEDASSDLSSASNAADAKKRLSCKQESALLTVSVLVQEDGYSDLSSASNPADAK